jgi:hypothetical protein
MVVDSLVVEPLSMRKVVVIMYKRAPSSKRTVPAAPATIGRSKRSEF